MNIASFKERYPHFTDDSKITIALSDADVLIESYDIDEGKRDLALAYLTAHLLVLDAQAGATESKVKKVKADTVEVEFSDKNNDVDWLDLTSYGKLLKILATPKPDKSTKGYGIVKDCDKGAITFDRRDLFDGHVCTKGGFYD